MRSKYAKKVYKGQEKRDAAPSVRGFIYQSLIALESVIDNEDSEIYIEVGEDVYIEDESDIKLIQAKYYPDSSLNYKEIYKELYFEYLYLLLNGCDLNIKTSIYFYRGGNAYFPDISDKIGDFLEDNTGKEIDDKKILQELINIEDKDGQEEYLLKNYSTQIILDNFIENIFENKKTSKLSKYYKEIENKLGEALKKEEMFSEIDFNINENRCIAMAVAVSYIENAYYEEKTKIEERICKREYLWDKIKNVFVNENSITEKIISWICDVINIVYSEIIENESVANSDENFEFYTKLKQSTTKYMKQYLVLKENRFKFINTISKLDASKIDFDIYIKADIREIEIIWQHRSEIEEFVYNCWKLLFNLKCSEFSKYINNDDLEYLWFNFPNDELDKSIIMGQARRSCSLSNIQSRILRYKSDDRPQKWFIDSQKYRGKFKYESDYTQMVEEYISPCHYVENNIYYIECLECLDVDEMGKIDDCNECLFKETCIKDGDK